MLQVYISELNLDFKNQQAQLNEKLELESKPVHEWHLIVKVVQKLNTIVMRNGRKILKFNVTDE